MSEAAQLELVKNLPTLITVFFLALGGFLTSIILKLNHIKELTNSSMTEAKTEIKSLKDTVIAGDDKRFRLLEDEILSLRAERQAIPSAIPHVPGGDVAPIAVEVKNPPHEPANVKLSEDAVKATIEAVKEEGG